MTTYEGLCIGGPWKGRYLASLDRVYPLALMSEPHGNALPGEIRRGWYDHDPMANAWWWRGWGDPPEAVKL